MGSGLPWLGITQLPQISWAKSYELADVAMEMGLLQNMQASGFPPEVIQEQMANIVGLQFSNLDADTIDTLHAAVELTAQERQPQQPDGASA